MSTRTRAKRRVRRCLNILQAEIDELTPSDAVVAITSAWGLSMRPPSNSLILSRRNREKRAQLAQQRDRRLHRRLNPPLDHSKTLMPRFIKTIKTLLPGDPTNIMSGGLGLPPPPVLMETIQQLCFQEHMCFTASISSEKLREVESKYEDKEDQRMRQRDPKHYKLIQDARSQQNKLREGIAHLQTQVIEIQNMVGRTTSDNNIALRLSHEATQRKLEERKQKLSKDIPIASQDTSPLWLLPIHALESILRSDRNPKNQQTPATNHRNKQNQRNRSLNLKANQRRKKLRNKKFRNDAMRARGLTVGLSVPGMGRSLYSLSKDAATDKKFDREDDEEDEVTSVFLKLNDSSVVSPLKKKLAKLCRASISSISSAEDFSKRSLLQRVRRVGIGQKRKSSRSQFRLSESIVRRFEYELLKEDRIVSQVLCHLWLLTITFSSKQKSGKNADPFQKQTVVAAIEQLLESNNEKRNEMEQELITVWRLVTSSRIFREENIHRNQNIAKNQMLKSSNGPAIKTNNSKQRIRPSSAHAGSVRRMIPQTKKRTTIIRNRPSTAGSSGRSSSSKVPNFIPSTSTRTNLSSTTILRGNKQRPQSALPGLRFQNNFGDFLHQTRTRLKMPTTGRRRDSELRIRNAQFSQVFKK